MALIDALDAALTAAPRVQDSSKVMYLGNIRRLMSGVDVDDLNDLLRSADKLIEHLRERDTKDTTVKTYLASVLAVATHMPEVGVQYSAEFQKLREYFEELSEAITERADTNEPSEKQLARYVPMDRLDELFGELLSAAGVYGPRERQRKHLQLLVLLIATQLVPKRADGCTVRIFKSDADIPADAAVEKQTNYISMEAGNERLKLNSWFKTGNKDEDATREPILESLTPAAVQVIRRSIEAWPREYLFEGRGGKPFTANAYSKMFQRKMKELTGKDVCLTDVRHIFVTDRVDLNNMSMGEKKRIARLMGHGTMVQALYKYRMPRSEAGSEVASTSEAATETPEASEASFASASSEAAESVVVDSAPTQEAEEPAEEPAAVATASASVPIVRTFGKPVAVALRGTRAIVRGACFLLQGVDTAIGVAADTIERAGTTK